MTFPHGEARSTSLSLELMRACDCLDQQNKAEVMSFQVLAEAWRDHSVYLLSGEALSCHMDRSYLTTVAGEITHRGLKTGKEKQPS